MLRSDDFFFEMPLFFTIFMHFLQSCVSRCCFVFEQYIFPPPKLLPFSLENNDLFLDQQHLGSPLAGPNNQLQHPLWTDWLTHKFTIAAFADVA